MALMVVMALTMGLMATGAGAIEQKGTVAGKIVDSTGAPIAGATIRLINPVWGGSSDTTETIADGTYQFTDIPIGLYKVVFEATDKLDQYYSGKFTFEEAQTINLSANEALAGIDATLVGGGAVEGTLTAGDGIADPSDIDSWVTLYGASGEYIDDVLCNNVDHTFKFTGLLPGTYKVQARPTDYWNSLVQQQWFDGKSTFDSATSLVVAAESTKTASMTMQLGAVIKGRVTNGVDGLPGSVRLFDESGDYVESVSCDSTGNYVFSGLHSGSYRVYAEKWEYVGEYYNDKTSLFAANPVAVAGTQTVEGIDFVLVKGKKITGKVVDPAGKALPYIDVNLEGTTSGGEEIRKETSTGSDGKWEVNGLPAGTYKAEFDPEPINSINTTLAPATGFVGEWYNDKPTVWAADVLTIDTTNVVGVDATLAVGGSIKGKVTNADGAAVGGLAITVWTDFGDHWGQVAWGTSAADGTYEVKGVPAGTAYAVQFGDDSYYGGGREQDLAKKVAVVAGQATTGIDGVYTEDDGSLYGTVYGADGQPAQGVKAIFAREGQGGTFTELPGDNDFTDDEGRFETRGLGKVKVRFVDPQGRFLDAYYGGTSASDAKTIQLESDKSVAITQTLQFKSADSAEGGDRFATSVAVSKRAFPDGCASLLIATGRNWPDALGAAGLAGWSYGPILLVDKDAIPTVVMDEITRLANQSHGFSKVYILGSESVVSTKVENSLRAMFDQDNEEKTVVRLAGATRYETAGKITDELIKLEGTRFEGTALVATGLNYPDALGASPVAAALGLPLFLVDANGVTDAVANTMVSKGIKRAVILGSDKVVSKASADKLLAKLGAGNVTRLAGGTRYTTAIEVAKYGVSRGMSFTTVGFATGTNFPDALSGGVLQGLNENVMLLTPGTSLDPSVEALVKEKKASIFEVRFFGSTAAISKAVRDKIAAALK